MSLATAMYFFELPRWYAFYSLRLDGIRIGCGLPTGPIAGAILSRATISKGYGKVLGLLRTAHQRRNVLSFWIDGSYDPVWTD